MFLSYSKLKTFRECRLRYRLQYVNRLPRAPRGFARLGQRVHATIRRAYQYASDGKFTREQLQKHYEDVCDVVRQPEVAQSREFGTGLTILENFYRTVEGIPARPVMLEQRFKVEIGEHLLTGQFDRVDLREDTGGYEILDYKMGKAMLSPAEVDHDWQLGLYGLAFESMQGVVPERMSLVYLRNGEKRSTTWSREQLAGLWGEVQETASEMQREHTFEPCDGSWCRLCDYRDYCPLRVALPQVVPAVAVQRELPF